MGECRKNDVLEKLKAALEAGLYKARLLKKHGLPPDTPARLPSYPIDRPPCRILPDRPVSQGRRPSV